MKIKHYQDRSLTEVLWYIHLFLGIISALCVILFFNGYVLRGIYTGRVFLSLYAGSGMILYSLSTEKGTARKAYLAMFYSIPFILLGGLLLPPLRLFTVVASIWLLVDGEFKRYPIDNDYTLQTCSTAVINARYPTYSLVQGKYWLFEKVTDDVIAPYLMPSDIKTKRINADSIQLHIYTDQQQLDTVIVVE
ncbi:hypothetical protein DCM91_08655 [Chitinophaga costaii]|nr:hypothetical protein DCM91_08655 [Chitinophaga costaii]